jgi:hypothetical protein
MSESKARWDEVGDRFNDVAKRLKDHYDAQQASRVQDQPNTEDAENADKMNDALKQISAALDKGFTTIGESIRDPAVHDDLKRAGTAMADALAATFKQASEEVKKRLS